MKKIQVYGVADENTPFEHRPFEYRGPIKKEKIILVVKLVEHDKFFTDTEKNEKVYKEDAEKLAELFEKYLPTGTVSEFIKILYEHYPCFLSETKK